LRRSNRALERRSNPPCTLVWILTPSFAPQRAQADYAGTHKSINCPDRLRNRGQGIRHSCEDAGCGTGGLRPTEFRMAGINIAELGDRIANAAQKVFERQRGRFHWSGSLHAARRRDVLNSMGNVRYGNFTGRPHLFQLFRAAQAVSLADRPLTALTPSH
jgi:hypothetical protein